VSPFNGKVELGVVIGRTARYLEAGDDPLSYVAGYAVSHDVSEREFQLERGGQWDKAGQRNVNRRKRETNREEIEKNENLE